jgi:hypothetical protein
MLYMQVTLILNIYIGVLPGIEKQLYHLPQSQNNCTKYPVLYVENSGNHNELQ